MSIKVSEPTGLGTDPRPMIINLQTNLMSPAAYSRMANVFAAADIDLSKCYVVYEATNHTDLMNYINSNWGDISAILVCGKASQQMFVGAKCARKDGEMVKIKAIPTCTTTDVLYTYSASEVHVDRDKQYNFMSHLQYFRLLAYNEPLLELKADYNFMLSEMPVSKIQKLLRSTTSLAYDIESTGLDPVVDKLTMIGLAGRLINGKTWTGIIAPWGGFYSGLTRMYNPEWDVCVKTFPTKVVAHHSRFDNMFLDVNGWAQPEIDMDTMHLAHHENELQSKKLKHLLRYKLGAKAYELDIDFKTKAKTMTFHEVADYCRKDCLGTLLLREYYEEAGFPIQDTTGKWAPHYANRNYLVGYVMQTERLLQRIEARGVFVDKAGMGDTERDLLAQQHTLELVLNATATTHGMAGMNFKSNQQLMTLLYDKMGIKPIYRDEVVLETDDDEEENEYVENKHVLTVNSSALKRMAHDGSMFAVDLLKYRKISKMLDGFIRPWTADLDATHSSRLHPAYHSARVRTFRLSSSGPNLQQVSRDPIIRNLIAAPAGAVFIEADYSQIELRVAAVIGRIESMKKIYRAGGDIHTNTARALAKMKHEDYDTLSKTDQKSYRTKAKAVNFGFIYGMSAKGFQAYAADSYDLYITLKEAEAFRDLYFRLYPELVTWHAITRTSAGREGIAPIATGRIRHVPNVFSPNQYLRGRALRQAINTPVQGLASEIMMVSMLYLEQIMNPNMGKLVGQCHDAMFVEVFASPAMIDKVCDQINTCMTGAITDRLFDGINFDIPLEAEIKVGKCWGDPTATVWKKSA